MKNLDQVCEKGQGMIILIQGEQGCGKSTLANELAETLIAAGLEVQLHEEVGHGAAQLLITREV